jgi:hypothetical protein
VKEFLRDFGKRVDEINKYFDFVDKVEQLGAFSTNSVIFPSGDYNVDSDLQKILKSHCYLLLYNLIESSIRNGITAIHDAISIEKLTYRDLSPKIKMLWLLNDRSKSFLDSNIKKETIAKNLQEVIRLAMYDEVVELDPTNIPISGNLDSKTIKELVNMYGFYGDLGISAKEIDNILDFVVKIRCDLAHGNVSFCDASNEIIWSKSANTDDSREKVFRYLIDDKENVVKYLTNMLQNIDGYIDRKEYKS